MPRAHLDVGRARRQHAEYVRALRALSVKVVTVPALPDAPDGVFVEDCAVVTDEIAIVTRPGAPSRRVEVPSVAASLRRYRSVQGIAAPGALDGGDVLRCGRDVYVGRSARTNEAGIAQLAEYLEPLDYRVHAVPVTGCLHLKSAVTVLPDGTLIGKTEWVDPACFGRRPLISAPPAEPRGANVLAVRGSVLVPADCPATVARLREAGYAVVPIECAELGKAEGGLTCCCILFRG